MRVRKVRMQKFMAYNDASFDLPEVGAILVAGANGTGKSSIIEAVASLYNTSLRAPKSRRTRGFHTGVAGEVTVETYDGLVANRGCTASGALKLEYSINGDSTSFPTPTKALEQFGRDVGPEALWRRCCYFSSKIAAGFSEATDADRRDLLEELVSLGDYSLAQAKAVAAQNDATKLVAATRTSLAVAESQLASVDRDVASARSGLASLTPPVAPGTDVELNALRVRCTELLQEEAVVKSQMEYLSTADFAAQQEMQEHALATRSLEVARDQAMRQMSVLGNGYCPTCELEVPEDRVSELHGAVKAANQQLAAHLAAVELENQKINSEASIRAQTRAELQRKQADIHATYVLTQNQGVALASALKSYSQLLAQHQAQEKQWADLVASADQRKQQAAAEVVKLKAELATQEHAVELATYGAWVLGPNGVRTQLLTEVLGAVESMTNRWLALMSPTIRVDLKAYDESSKAAKKSISLKIHGRTSGDEYYDLSTGERLRVDLAFLFGFAEVTELIHGGSATSGTLFLDEIFDGVDTVGAAAAIDLIREVAKTRAVVVISHNDAIKDRLQPVMHYQLKGKV